ncbi:hypothetical protein [Belnapia sp. F-4-1]|uniref:hypothetical protein n=1 Tax=Belnapia sp. F-4-1 TaxID=1545443 RepID=UPI0005BDD74E|nr:hypothetical protein [Belnapia sp. F-4-1]
MTVVRLSERLTRLERRGAGWKAYEGVPVEQWPDVALWSLLGLPESTSDAELQRIANAPPPAEARP